MSVQISGIGFDPETNTLNVLFTGDEVLDVNTLYGSGDTSQLRSAVDSITACVGVLSNYAAAGNKAIILSKCNGVQEGQECLISTKRWERKEGKLVRVDGHKLNVIFSFKKEDGTYGPEIPRAADIVTIEPYVQESEG